MRTSTFLRMAALAALLALGAGVARAHEYNKQTFDVAEDLTTFNVAPGVTQSGGAFPDGAFYVSGDIYPGGTLLADGSVPAGAVPIGKWFCSGFLAGGFFTSTDVYRFDGGQIVASQAGPLDFSAPLTKAITGGTGVFKGATGEAEWHRLNFPVSLNFRVTFFK